MVYREFTTRVQSIMVGRNGSKSMRQLVMLYPQSGGGGEGCCCPSDVLLLIQSQNLGPWSGATQLVWSSLLG